MESLTTRIEAQMRLSPEEVYFPSDFFDLGPQLRVNKALSRLVEQGQAWRLTRGMYAVFTKSRFGKILPKTGSLAKNYADKAGAIVTEIGAAATNVLGFSTQNVLKEIYLTSAKSMIWQIGSQVVEFRQGSDVELFLGNRLEGMLVRAWKYMGEDESLEALPSLRRDVVGRINWDIIVNAGGVLPEWMCNLAKKGKFYKWS